MPAICSAETLTTLSRYNAERQLCSCPGWQPRKQYCQRCTHTLWGLLAPAQQQLGTSHDRPAPPRALHRPRRPQQQHVHKLGERRRLAIIFQPDGTVAGTRNWRTRHTSTLRAIVLARLEARREGARSTQSESCGSARLQVSTLFECWVVVDKLEQRQPAQACWFASRLDT